MDKVKSIHPVWDEYDLKAIHSMLSGTDELNSMTLSYESTKILTKLSDLLSAMSDCDRFSEYLQNLANVNASLPLDSSLWPGCTVLHLAVFMGENIKLWEEIFKKSDSQQKLDLLLQVYNPTEEDKRKYQEIINICLTTGCSVTMKNTNGATPIHLAFKLHKVEIINLLLDRCENNSADVDDLSFFHIACATGNVDVVRRLINAGADVNSGTRSIFKWFYECPSHLQNPKADFIIIPVNSTALHIAAIFQNEPIINLLLDSGADIYAQNALGLTPIHLSMISCHECQERHHGNAKSIAQLLFIRAPILRESLSNSGLSHLHIAAYADDADAIEKLLKMGANIDSVFRVTVPELSFLARYANRTPLHVAILMWSPNAVATLINSGADISKQTPEIRTPLQTVLWYYREELAICIGNKFKQDQRFKEAIDENGVTLLHVACWMYDLEWAEELLKKGADVNAQVLNDHEDDDNWKGFTPMHMLIDAIFDNVDGDRQKMDNFVKLLMQYGANLLTTSHNGQSSLLYAHNLAREFLDDDDDYEISERYGPVLFPVADLLLKSQPSYEVNPVNRQGFSHFHYACMRNQVDVAKKFLDNGIEINHTANVCFREDYNGMDFTPLHFAVFYRSIEVACLLIERGANVNAVNGAGETPLHIALIRGLVDFHLFEMLFSNGADINARTCYGRTSISCLFAYNNEITHEQLKFFRAHGSSIDIASDEYQGEFALAIRNAKPCDREAIFEELIDFCNVKNAVKNNCNPIETIVAVHQNGKLTIIFYLDAIQRFIDMGCKLDHQDEKGETALHRATEYKNLEAVKALLLVGANVNVIDKDNKPPIRTDFTSERGAHTAQMLATHVWKMKVVGLQVHELCEAAMLKIHEEFPLEERLQRQCENELANLSKEDIGESLTMKCFLREWGAAMDYPTMSFAQRHNVDQFFAKLADVHQNFPAFSGLLVIQYRKALVRNNMFKIAMSALPSVLQVDLPYLCLENILKYFDNDELGYFIEGHTDSSSKNVFV